MSMYTTWVQMSYMPKKMVSDSLELELQTVVNNLVNVGAGNRTHVLWENTKCLMPL